MSTNEIRTDDILRHPAFRPLHAGLLRPAELGQLVRLLAADERLWRPHAVFAAEERWHARLHWTPAVEVYLLSWDTGQDTRIHDHGGSSGAFCVTDGELFEEHGTVFGATLRERTHPRGAVTSFGPSYLHNLGNRRPSGAISIHAYSPPLSVMRFYDADDGRLVPRYQLPVAGPEPDDDAEPVRLDAVAAGVTS